MRPKKRFLAVLFFTFFLFDLIRPFGYFFLPNLTFLAVIAISIQNKLFFSLIFGLLAGAVWDSVIFSGNPFYVFEYPLMALAVYFFNNCLQSLKIKIKLELEKFIIVMLVLSTHFFLLSFLLGGGNLIFFFTFFIQACLAYFLIDSLLRYEN